MTRLAFVTEAYPVHGEHGRLSVGRNIDAFAHRPKCRWRHSPNIPINKQGVLQEFEENFSLNHHVVAMSDNDNEIIAPLLRQRAAINRQLNAFVPAVSVPPEILSTIFEFACRYPVFEVDFLEGDECAGGMTPIQLGAVCSAWRRVSLGASQLWASIEMKLNSAGESQAALLQYWLSNAGNRPLFVKLLEDRGNPDPPTAVLNVLVTYARQLHTLDIVAAKTWEPAMMQIGKCALRLRRLILSCADRDSEPLSPIDCFSNVPQLREVTLDTTYTISDASLPWSQLAHLFLRNISIDDCLEALRHCHRLRRFIADGTQGSHQFEGALSSVKHTGLEELQVRYSDSEDLEMLLKALTLPVLRSLLVHQWADSMPCIKLLPPFLKRSTCALESLYLVNMDATEHKLLACLRLLPTLRKLWVCVEHWTFTQHMLDLMNPKKQVGDQDAGNSADAYLLPNLEILHFAGSVEVTPHALIEFLADRYRWKPSGEQRRQRLRSVTLRSTKQIVPTDFMDVASLQELRREGIHVDLREFRKFRVW